MHNLFNIIDLMTWSQFLILFFFLGCIGLVTVNLIIAIIEDFRREKRGFVDFGLLLLFVAAGMGGAVVVNQLTKDKKAETLCKAQGQIQIGASLYECKKIDSLKVKK